MSDFELEESNSDQEQLNELVKLIVCGKLRGTLPKGFLSVMKQLPDELLLNIWSYLQISDRLSIRLVCKRWLKLWELCSGNKLEIYGILLHGVVENKFTMVVEKAISWEKSTKKAFEWERKHELTRRALSLVYLKKPRECFYFDPSLMLVIADGAANLGLLHAVAAQRWQMSSIVLRGKQNEFSVEQLLDFFSRLSWNRTGPFTLIFEGTSFPHKFNIDKLIELCGGSFNQLWIVPPPSPYDNLMRRSLEFTDRGLINFVEFGRSVLFPSSEKVSLQGIASYIHAFLKKRLSSEMETDWYAGELITTVSENITARAIADLNIGFKDEELKINFYNEKNECGDPVTRESLTSSGVIKYSHQTELLVVRVLSERGFWRTLGEFECLRRRIVHNGSFKMDVESISMGDPNEVGEDIGDEPMDDRHIDDDDMDAEAAGFDDFSDTDYDNMFFR